LIPLEASDVDFKIDFDVFEVVVVGFEVVVVGLAVVIVGFDVVFLGFELALGGFKVERRSIGGAMLEGPSLSLTFDIETIKITNVYQHA
jgi:hypothetical protein